MRMTMRGAIPPLLVILGGLSARGDEKVVAIRAVPPAVMKAAKAAAPGVEFAKATVETGGKASTYEIEGKDKHGDEVIVTVDGAGSVVDLATEVEVGEVPKPVTAALMKQMPKFKVADAYEVEVGGKLAGYRFEGKDAKGAAVTATVTPDGGSVKVEKD